MFFFFKQKTAYEMRISDWSSDVCSSDLLRHSEVRILPGLPNPAGSSAISGQHRPSRKPQARLERACAFQAGRSVPAAASRSPEAVHGRHLLRPLHARRRAAADDARARLCGARAGCPGRAVRRGGGRPRYPEAQLGRAATRRVPARRRQLSPPAPRLLRGRRRAPRTRAASRALAVEGLQRAARWAAALRSEEHTSELQSLMRISYAVFCLKKKNIPAINKRIS